MARISLAFRCFFRLLFGRDLPREAGEFLPPGAAPPALLPEATKAEVRVDAKAEPRKEARPEPVVKAEPKVEARPSVSRTDMAGHHKEGALALLALLQREGRLVDFLREALDGYADADIGAAVRDIHRGCSKVLDEHFALEPVMPGEEEARGRWCRAASTRPRSA